jgi:hypothetical protein
MSTKQNIINDQHMNYILYCVLKYILKDDPFVQFVSPHNHLFIDGECDLYEISKYFNNCGFMYNSSLKELVDNQSILILINIELSNISDIIQLPKCGNVKQITFKFSKLLEIIIKLHYDLSPLSILLSSDHIFVNKLFEYVRYSIPTKETFKHFMASSIIELYDSIILFGSSAYNLKHADDLDFMGDINIFQNIIYYLKIFFSVFDTYSVIDEKQWGKQNYNILSKDIFFHSKFLIKIDFVTTQRFNKLPQPDFYECSLMKSRNSVYLNYETQDSISLSCAMNNLEKMILTPIPLKIITDGHILQMFKLHERKFRRIRNGYTISGEMPYEQYIIFHDDKMIQKIINDFIESYDVCILITKYLDSLFNKNEKCIICEDYAYVTYSKPFMIRSPKKDIYHVSCMKKNIEQKGNMKYRDFLYDN